MFNSFWDKIHKNKIQKHDIKKKQISVINSDGCVLCGACARFCPTGSISFQDSNNTRTIKHDYSLCSSCMICQNICITKDGVRMKEDFENYENSLSDKIVTCEMCNSVITTDKHLEFTGKIASAKSYSNPTLFIHRLSKVNLTKRFPSKQNSDIVSSDRLRILCSKCRAKIDRYFVQD